MSSFSSGYACPVVGYRFTAEDVQESVNHTPGTVQNEQCPYLERKETSNEYSVVEKKDRMTCASNGQGGHYLVCIDALINC